MITVETQYWDGKSLASTYVHTPDPAQFCPDIGQKLLISWSVPSHYVFFRDLHLEVQIRFRCHQECAFSLPVKRSSGTHVYRVMNDRFAETGGILSYRVVLVAQGKVEEVWQHPLWTPVLKLDDGL